MDLVSLLNAMIENIKALQLQLADAQASADALAKGKYDEGFAAGVASVVPVGNDKIYSQAEVDAKMQPLQDQISALQVQVADLQSKVVDVDAVKAQAVADFKAILLQKYNEQQVVESQSETGFSDLLK